ncbi:fibrinogen-like protein 1-like protein [Mantella aurantiaca]
MVRGHGLGLKSPPMDDPAIQVSWVIPFYNTWHAKSSHHCSMGITHPGERRHPRRGSLHPAAVYSEKPQCDERGSGMRVPENEGWHLSLCQAGMDPRWICCSVFLLTLCGISCSTLTHVSQQDLYKQIANKHLLNEAQLGQLVNVPASGVFRELVAKDCRAAYLNLRRRSGFYVIWPKDSSPLVVYCDLSSEGAGWTLLQRKVPGDDASFWSRDWKEYKDGFGNLLGSHWLGNEMIYRLTRQNAFTVRFIMVDGLGNRHYADYSSFRVDSEDSGYALRLGDYSGNAGDALTLWNETGVHDNMRFSTKGADHDRWGDSSCAEVLKGGWWFDKCRSALLNTDGDVYWGDACDKRNPCVTTAIMIRPGGKNCSPIPLPGAGEHYPIHDS